MNMNGDKLYYQGKEVYTTGDVSKIIGINQCSIFYYLKEKNKAVFLIKGKDFEILSDSDKVKFLKENPSYRYGKIYLKYLYYESTITKIMEYRKKHERRRRMFASKTNTDISNQNTVKENNPELRIESNSLDLNLVMNLLLRLDLENKRLAKRISCLESQISKLERREDDFSDNQDNEELSSMLAEYLKLKKGA